MIGVRLDGRLGNQLFQYAFAFSLAKKYHTFYIIDNDYKEDYVKKYFKTNVLLNNKISRGIFKKVFANKLPFIRQGGDEATDSILPLIGNNQFYKGFFQSELYFQDLGDTLQNLFQIKQVYKVQFFKKYSQLFDNKKVLAIHYRLGDFLTWGSKLHGGFDLSLPESYYNNALQQIGDIHDYSVVVVTDDKKGVNGKLKSIKNKLVISDQEIIDFQILMHADMIITSNSSFCWWAAYLNPKNPTVFAPKYWVGFKVNSEMPNNVLPDKFIKIDVY